ncbi:DUF1822 family protein [Phormidium tenue FACHB-886]|nr:DUF1822 family protein [Phormidium tenue FACHB-886]
MIYQPPDFIDLLDSEALSDESIELSLEQVDRAARLAQSIPKADQWQAYIHALALFGFKQWLEEWASDLEIDDSHCSICQPKSSNRIDAVYNLKIRHFNICLLATTTLAEVVVEIPQFIPESPHTYVLIEVHEEQMQVQLYGYLRRDRLLAWQQSCSTAERFSIPLTWFIADPTALLLELRCLEPELLPQPPDPQAISVGCWLSDRLDKAAQTLRWILLPPSVMQHANIDAAFAPALRSASNEINEIVFAGVDIPSAARGAYQDLQLGTAALRLHAFTWVLSPTVEHLQWTLLIILGAQPQSQLPVGIQLQVRDEKQLLFEQALEEETTGSYLYAQVGGDLTDQFWVTIDLPDGDAIASPPFVFGLNPQ